MYRYTANFDTDLLVTVTDEWTLVAPARGSALQDYRRDSAERVIYPIDGAIELSLDDARTDPSRVIAQGAVDSLPSRGAVYAKRVGGTNVAVNVLYEGTYVGS